MADTPQTTTRLSDLPITSDVALKALILRTMATNAFVNSGVMARDAQLDSFLSSEIGGKTISPRFIGPLAIEEPNISTDDPAMKSDPKKITGGRNKAVRQSLNQSWSSMDLNASLLGADPVAAITNQIGDYWSGVLSKYGLSSPCGTVRTITILPFSRSTFSVSDNKGLRTCWLAALLISRLVFRVSSGVKPWISPLSDTPINRYQIESYSFLHPLQGCWPPPP